jgi:hypothetical protein
MLPQNCFDIHNAFSHDDLSNRKLIEYPEKQPLFNNICCFDYLIYIEEYYTDNMMENFFYRKFIKIIYELDKKNVFDFENYSKETLLKFIIILNKGSCYFYAHKKINYSKYLCNLTVKISQILVKPYIKITQNTFRKDEQLSERIKDINLIINIYNNACCNYLKTLSYSKSLKFLEYSYKNIEENDINSELIYYNNLLIISTKNLINYENINVSMNMLDKLIQTRKIYFNNIYCNNIDYNNGDNSDIIKNKLQENNEDYKNFKLLCFVIYNYIFFIDNIIKNKEGAKNLYQINYEYITKYLGKSSFESQKFLAKLRDINIKVFNLKNEDNNNSLENESDSYNKLIGKNIKNAKGENDINLRLNNILEKIEEFEEILKNEKIAKLIQEKKISKEITNYKTEIKEEKTNLLEKNKTEKIIKQENYTEKIKEDNIKSLNSEINIKNENKENDDNQKKKITFDMMDNIIEEFKKESQEKLDEHKKIEKEKKDDNIIINNNNIEISKPENNNKSQPKKAPKIKNLFQKVLGRSFREPRKTKLGELFESLMSNKQEEKQNNENIQKEEKIEVKEEIKVEKENNDNFINLDDEDDDNDNNMDNINNKNEKENNLNINNNINQNFGYGFKININLDNSDYSYDATTLYQKNEN